MLARQEISFMCEIGKALFANCVISEFAALLNTCDNFDVCMRIFILYHFRAGSPRYIIFVYISPYIPPIIFPPIIRVGSQDISFLCEIEFALIARCVMYGFTSFLE